MGHASSRAALIYLHGSDKRQRKIASNLDVLARQELVKSRSEAPGSLAAWHGCGTKLVTDSPGSVSCGNSV